MSKTEVCGLVVGVTVVLTLMGWGVYEFEMDSRRERAEREAKYEATPLMERAINRAAFAIVAANPMAERKTITHAFDAQSRYSDAGLWEAIGEMIHAGYIRVGIRGMVAAPREEWPKK